MSLKILQLNIWQCAFIHQIIDFVEKNSIDILHFQEVASGKLAHGGSNFYPGISTHATTPVGEKNIGIDSFREIQNGLIDYHGFFAKTWQLENMPDSCTGNATFLKNTLKPESLEIFWIHPFREISDENARSIVDDPHNAIIVKANIQNRNFYLVNTHLAWGPTDTDEEYKIIQAKKLFEYLKTLDEPIILTGDFNVSPETQTASGYEQLGENLTRRYKIINTLNPRTHNAKHLFPNGLAVDMFFVNHKIKVKKFRVVDEIDLSDHFGLLAEIQI